LARTNRWSMSDRQAFFVAGLVTLGAFLIFYGVGLSNVAIIGLGVAMVILGPALSLMARIRGSREYVYGTAHVHDVSPLPPVGTFGRCELQLVVNARGVNGVAVRVRDAAVPISKWPDVGATLPVMVAVDNPRRVQILWNDVLTHRQAASSDEGYPNYAEGSTGGDLDGPSDEDPYDYGFYPPETTDRDFEYSPTGSGPPTAYEGAGSSSPLPSHWPGTQTDPQSGAQPGHRPSPRPSPRQRPGSDDVPRSSPGDTMPSMAPGTETFSTVGPGAGAGLAIMPVTSPDSWPPAESAVNGLETPAPLPARVPTPRPFMADLETPPPPIVPSFGGQTLEFTLREQPSADVDSDVEPSALDEGAVAHFLPAGPTTSPPATSPPSTAPPAPAPSLGISGVSVTLIVADLQRSRRFYRDIVGMDEVDSFAQTAVLTLGEAGVVLRQVTDMATIDRRVVQVDLWVDDVQLWYERLRAKGVEFVHEPKIVPHGEDLDLCSAMFRDPDGHAVTLMRSKIRR
jgi:catechol 2,3-dioxygenase-like lactoylglutathione lyase family enzyme